MTVATPRLCIATGGRARYVTHSINKQSFVNKCNNSNSCKVFYLDYKNMLIYKLPQTPYMAFPLDIAGLSAGKYSLFCIQHIYFLNSNGTCWETKSADFVVSIHVTHLRLYKCLQVHVIANARQARCVLVRLSPNWPNTNETEVNGRC